MKDPVLQHGSQQKCWEDSNSFNYLSTDHGVEINHDATHVQRANSKQKYELSNTKLNNWLQSFGLKSRKEVPDFCHESFIHHGYRPNPSSTLYCIRSVFHPTNETFNFWTHAIPGLILTWRFWSFMLENVGDRSYADSLLWPYWFFVFGTSFTFLGSACAHAFNCISPGVRETCFCCDYGFIAIQALGVTNSFTFYLCPFLCVVPKYGFHILWYISTLLGNNLTVSAACFTRYPGVPHRYLLRMIPFATMYTFLSFPCAYKYSNNMATDYGNLTNADVTNQALTCSILSTPQAGEDFATLCLVMMLGAIIQAVKVPERLKPGMFDIVGHSHQIFHLLMAYGMYLQSVLIQEALKEILTLQRSRHFTALDLGITPLTGMMIPLASVTLSCTISIYFSYKLSKKARAAADRKLERGDSPLKLD